MMAFVVIGAKLLTNFLNVVEDLLYAVFRLIVFDLPL
jgi:hypothetical protein